MHFWKTESEINDPKIYLNLNSLRLK